MILEILAIKEINKPVEIPQPKPQATVQVEPQKKPKQIKTYKVVKSDTLISIAKKHKTSWQRLFYKNKSIKNPDQLDIGQRIVIPPNNEKLKKRNYMLVEAERAKEPIERGSSVAVSGNTYEAGQCVWHVKNLKPEIPNGWGSAYQWLYNAQASGWATGSTPRAGAVGVRGNHVVYVLKVKGSQVLISEMNYDWVAYHQREIWKPASNYTYIY